MRNDFQTMTLDELVDLYVETGIQQYKALDDGNTRLFGRLLPTSMGIEKELKSRDGDQRSALLPLYSHPNLQVRLNAARATRAIAPDVARSSLERISELNWNPQSMDAGMSLWFWDEGISKPD